MEKNINPNSERSFQLSSYLDTRQRLLLFVHLSWNKKIVFDGLHLSNGHSLPTHRITVWRLQRDVMGDTIDVTGDNTLVLCFGFLLSKKQWLSIAKKLRVTYRNIFRFLRVMQSFSDSPVNCRAGHVAVKYGTDSILVWGGYKENRDDEEQPLDHDYWPPNQVWYVSNLLT